MRGGLGKMNKLITDNISLWQNWDKSLTVSSNKENFVFYKRQPNKQFRANHTYSAKSIYHEQEIEMCKDGW